MEALSKSRPGRKLVITGTVMVAVNVLLLAIYFGKSFWDPQLVPLSSWHGAVPTVETCESYSSYAENVLGESVDVELAKTITSLPTAVLDGIQPAPLCLCDMGMSPLPGTVQITVGLPNGMDRDIKGLMMPEFDSEGYLISACVFLPSPLDFKVEPKVWRMIRRHELGHAWGFGHAFAFMSDEFDESEPWSFPENWGVPAAGHVMSPDVDLLGGNTRNMVLED